MKGLSYLSGDPVQGSFSHKSHQNLSIGSTAATSTTIDSDAIALSLTASAHVEIGANPTATTASMALPAGLWFLNIPSGSKISVIKLTGSVDGQASIIVMG